MKLCFCVAAPGFYVWLAHILPPGSWSSQWVQAIYAGTAVQNPEGNGQYACIFCFVWTREWSEH